MVVRAAVNEYQDYYFMLIQVLTHPRASPNFLALFNSEKSEYMTESIDHVHYELNHEIRAIGGHYYFLKEGNFLFRDQTILYYVGCAMMDSTCCGEVGVAFARVPGYIRDFRYKTDKSGAPISRIEPILDADSQIHISTVLRETESVSQIEF